MKYTAHHCSQLLFLPSTSVVMHHTNLPQVCVMGQNNNKNNNGNNNNDHDDHYNNNHNNHKRNSSCEFGG